jgi:thiamine biosynthesis lipoprotein
MPNICTFTASFPASESRRRIALGLPLAAAALWLVPQVSRAHTVGRQRNIMGTAVDIRVNHPDTALAQRGVDAAFDEMERLERMMSRYVAGNALAAVHAAAGIQAVPVPAEMFSVLQAGQAVAHASHGAFDMTIGALQDWDFRAGHYHAASPQAVKTQLPLVQAKALTLDATRSTVRLGHQGMRLDLGGIAKLPILQAGMRILQAHGISSAMVNGGGDVLVAGGNQGAPWHIGIRDPLRPAGILGTVALHDGVVASSGDYERCFAQNGQRFHHVLDPHTGYPSTGPHGVVLVSRDVAIVNGWGAATMVAGSAFGQEKTMASAGMQGLIVDRDGSTWASPGMRRLLQQA